MRRTGEEPASPRMTSGRTTCCVVLDGAQVLRGLPGMPQVLRQGPRAGVYTIAIDDDERLLPEECAAVVAAAASGIVRLQRRRARPVVDIRADQVTPAWCERLARSLAPLRDVSRDDADAGLPDVAPAARPARARAADAATLIAALARGGRTTEAFDRRRHGRAVRRSTWCATARTAWSPAPPARASPSCCRRWSRRSRWPTGPTS